MRAQIAAVVSSLDDQSAALARNTNLIQKKRQAELELAKITQDLELQEIARAEGAKEISPQEAAERRKQLEIAKVQSAADEKILQGREKVELLNEQRLAAGAEQVRIDERIAKLQQEEAELRDSRNALQRRQETAEEAIAKGEEEKKQTGLFGIGSKVATGEARIEGAELIFGEEQRRQLIEVEERLSQFEGSIETLKAARQAAEEQQMNLSVAQGEAFQIAALTETTETQAVELKTKLIEAKASNQVAAEARAEDETPFGRRREGAQAGPAGVRAGVQAALRRKVRGGDRIVPGCTRRGLPPVDIDVQHRLRTREVGADRRGDRLARSRAGGGH